MQQLNAQLSSLQRTTNVKKRASRLSLLSPGDPSSFIAALSAVGPWPLNNCGPGGQGHPAGQDGDGDDDDCGAARAAAKPAFLWGGAASPGGVDFPLHIL